MTAPTAPQIGSGGLCAASAAEEPTRVQREPRPTAARTRTEPPPQIARPQRSPWPANFPDVIVQQPHDSQIRLVKHRDYRAAKSGNVEAAARTVDHMTEIDAMERIGELVKGKDPIVVYPHAEEAAGRNKLPAAYAYKIADRFGLRVEPRIVQANRAARTGQDAEYRLLTPLGFDGPVEAGCNYVIADDMVTQGGTIADMRAYIEGQGGHVIGATTLAASRDSEILAPAAGLVAQLRREQPLNEAALQRVRGSDFAGLTRSEAHYLRRHS